MLVCHRENKHLSSAALGALITVSNRVFRSMLPLLALTCEREGGVPRRLREVVVANRTGQQGWVLTDAQLLQGLMELPLASFDREVRAHTRSLLP